MKNIRIIWLFRRLQSVCLALMVSTVFMGSPLVAETDPYTMLVQFNLYYDYETEQRTDDHAKYALELQRRLTYSTPIRYTQVLATHNSYNSDAYGAIWVGAEQSLRVKDQIDVGAEIIELDLHQFSGEQVFCHGSFYCNFWFDPQRVPIATVLGDLRDWAYKQDQHGTNRTVIVHIENAVSSGAQTTFKNHLISQIGLDYIYTPEDYKEDFPNGLEVANHKRTSLPSRELSREKIRQHDGLNGKKRFVFFWTKNDSDTDDNHETFDVVFDGWGGLNRHWKSGDDDSLDNWDDGINTVEHYDVSATDSRFQNKGLWSWGEGEPNDHGTGEDCAAIRSDGRFNDRRCDRTSVFACKRRLNGALHADDLKDDGAADYPLMWSLTTTKGAWPDGESECQALGSQWHFDVPRNMVESLTLKDKLAAAGETVAWIAYTDQDSEGTSEGDFVITTVDY
ncbi:hypothetical protein Misp06_02649 [Microbulbifer sp. NBRC 101763]|uniref:hypothetical protein n=1 Tax=unclassified Microbulbifer TaxID=2619833 RepID=UPI0024AD7E5D|nr:hypothetical protein [Microbulbifer sp. MLAF003]WHI53358.1 hypothetical protein P3339_11585 [Microbulbifer sp. MLAF003]